jgi:hypothetical protein
MDLMNNLIAEHGAGLLSTLTESGLSAEQARTFLPEAAQGIGDALGADGVSELLGGSDMGGIASSILGNLDVAGIASRAGIDPSLASNGLSALVPKVLSLLNAEGGGLASLLGGGGGLGGLAGMAGKLFNR